MTTQHTPGPWKTIYAPGQAGAYYLSAPDGVIGLINISGADEKLICAAPDLLSLAYDFGQMLTGLDPYSVDDVAIMRDKIKAAIAKATSQQGQ